MLGLLVIARREPLPALAIVMAWVALGETPPALALLGGALCLGGRGRLGWGPDRGPSP